MSPPGSVAVIGLGLMGGSLAHDLSARSIRVLGFDARADVLAATRAEGIVAESLPSDLDGIEAADLVLIATPVDAALDALDRVAARLGPTAVVTDVGSTKVAIAARAESLGLGARFVGSHPLAGDHRSGWEAARRGLYEGAPVFVCPTPSAAEESIARVVELWSALGAVPTLDEPAAHDRRMASISHLPQVIASALASTLDDEGIPPGALGPGGRDMTRLAASSPEMWAAICRANSGNLLPAIDRLQARLASARDAIAREDPDRLLDFFRRGRAWVA